MEGDYKHLGNLEFNHSQKFYFWNFYQWQNATYEINSYFYHLGKNYIKWKIIFNLLIVSACHLT